MHIDWRIFTISMLLVVAIAAVVDYFSNIGLLAAGAIVMMGLLINGWIITIEDRLGEKENERDAARRDEPR